MTCEDGGEESDDLHGLRIPRPPVLAHCRSAGAEVNGLGIGKLST